MATTKKGSKGQSATTIAMEVGAGLAVAGAAAGAGYYFYGDKNAKKHRAAATKWAKGMKADVLKEAKKIKKLDQKVIASIVDKASEAYATARSVEKKDLAAAARELKKHWKSIQTELEGGMGGAKKSVKKTVKKAAAPAKKAVKKSAKKASSKSR